MAVDIISAYRNVCRDLRGLTAYEPIARRTMEQAHMVMMKGKAPSSMMCYVPLDTAIESYNYAADEYNETTKTIDQLISVKVQMEKIIATMSDVEQIIIALNVEQGMDLKEIADKSNYSYGHIRNTFMKIRKEQQQVS